MSTRPIALQERMSVEQVEEDTDLAPKFDECRLITAATTDATSGGLLPNPTIL